MDETTITITTDDDVELQVYRWAPADEPKAAVQLHHGLGENAGRYRRFAEALTAAGYLVYAPDQRASGRTAKSQYGNWGPDGWAGWVHDYTLVNQRIREDNPGLKVALSALDNGRISLAAGCVGIGQGCLEACLSYASERRQFGRSAAGTEPEGQPVLAFEDQFG